MARREGHCSRRLPRCAGWQSRLALVLGYDLANGRPQRPQVERDDLPDAVVGGGVVTALQDVATLPARIAGRNGITIVPPHPTACRRKEQPAAYGIPIPAAPERRRIRSAPQAPIPSTARGPPRALRPARRGGNRGSAGAECSDGSWPQCPCPCCCRIGPP